MYLQSLMSTWGYEVVATVSSGEEAVSSICESPPDLVLMDIKLRGAMDGVEAARAIRGSLDLPIVFLTAFSDEHTLQRVGRSDAYGFVRKPLDERDLKIAVEMALYRHRADAALRQQRGWLDATLSSVADGVIATDGDGRIRFMNPAAEELTGWSRSSSFEHTLSDVLRPCTDSAETSPSDLVRSILSGAADTAGAPCMTVERADGTELAIELRAASIRAADEEPAGAVLLFHDVGERRVREERLVRLAHHDPLTGLPTRLLFEERLAQAIAQARRADRFVGLILLDLDGFKEINDRHGHTVGDRFLAAAAERVLRSVRKTDTAARYGGDEIAVVLPDLDTADGAGRAAAKLVAAFDHPFDIDGHELAATISAGVAVFPRDAEDGPELVECADEALYGAKRSGRARVVAHGGAGGDDHEVARIVERDLRKALERGDLEVHYQPIFEAASRRLAGAEALARWRHPEHGLISAADFLGTALRSGLVGLITDRVLAAACAWAAGWLVGEPQAIVGVNLNDSQLLRRDLVPTVASALAHSGLEPSRLQLEIAERTVVRPSAVLIENIEGLRRLGARVALDEFGSSHGAMVSLRRLPLDLLKIDRSLVAGLPHDAAACAIAEAALAGARRLGVRTAASGVEEPAQLEWLRDRSCTFVQGFLLGTACAADEFSRRFPSSGALGDGSVTDPGGAGS